MLGVAKIRKSSYKIIHLKQKIHVDFSLETYFVAVLPYTAFNEYFKFQIPICFYGNPVLSVMDEEVTL
jgi:hypothetical protein